MQCPACGHDTGIEASVINFMDDVFCPQCNAALIVVGGDTDWYLGHEIQNPYVLELKDSP